MTHFQIGLAAVLVAAGVVVFVVRELFSTLRTWAQARAQIEEQRSLVKPTALAVPAYQPPVLTEVVVMKQERGDGKWRSVWRQFAIASRWSALQVRRIITQCLHLVRPVGDAVVLATGVNGRRLVLQGYRFGLKPVVQIREIDSNGWTLDLHWRLGRVSDVAQCFEVPPMGTRDCFASRPKGGKARVDRYPGVVRVMIDTLVQGERFVKVIDYDERAGRNVKWLLGRMSDPANQDVLNGIGAMPSAA